MKYKSILSDDKSILRLMKHLSLLAEVVEVKKINHHPDYDFSEYRGPVTQTYFFKDQQPKPDNLFSVYEAEIVDSRILHWDDICELNDSLNLNASPDEESDWILAQAVANDENFIGGIGYDKLPQFALQQLEITEIDNSTDCVKLQGSFEGDGYGISQPDWALYAVIRFKGFKEDFNESEFYRQLLVESYQLRSKGDHRVSYFLAYAALEGFINRKLNSEGDSGRLSEKGRNLFQRSFPASDLVQHQIYSHVVSDFNNILTSTRNNIAHGRLVEVNENQSRHMLLVALMFISSIEFQAGTFAEIFRKTNSPVEAD